MSSHTHKQWIHEGVRRFGADKFKWVFKCPICKTAYTVQAFVDAGGYPEGAYMMCIGRLLPDSKSAFLDKLEKGDTCDYNSGGLFKFNPIDIEYNGAIVSVFEFGYINESNN